MLVANAVSRMPSESVNRNCAPECGRSFHDDSHSLWPAKKVQHAHQFFDPRPLAFDTVGVVGRGLRLWVLSIDDLGDGFGGSESDRVSQPPSGQILQEVVGTASRIGTDQHGFADLIPVDAGYLSQRALKDGDVISGGV